MSQRLLLLVTDLLIGGTPTVVRELAIRLKRQGVDVEVACLAKWGPTADVIRDAGIPVTALDARGILDLGVFSRLRRLVREHQIDVILSFLVHANVAAAYVHRRQPAVRVIQSIQTTQARPRWHWIAQGVAARSAGRIVVPSQSIAQVAQARSAIAAERIGVIPNAIDADAFAQVRPPSLDDQPAKIGFIGRLDPVKRIDDLVAAISLLGSEYQLAIYGAGSQRPAIERQIAQLGLAGRVCLCGVVARPQEALNQIGLLVLPSEAEGFGLVLIEAMAAGVPVVATDAPGIRDVVEHERTGLLVRIGDRQALADAIRRVREDSALRSGLVRDARKMVRERYSWAGALSAYRTVLGV